MADAEQAIKLTAKLYRFRNAAQFLWGDEYQQRSAEWRQAIELVAKAKKCGDLEAAIAIANQAQKDGAETVVLTVMAAYVEMVEPSKAEVAHG